VIRAAGECRFAAMARTTGVLRWTVAAVLTFACLLAACGKTTTVAEAEKKGDVEWLVANGSPEAVQVLGRLADTNPRAVEALRERPKTDIGVPIAAWHGHGRGQKWATDLMKEGLLDPARAETFASAMIRGNPRVLDFLPDLEESLVRSSASGRGSAVSGTIASLGKSAEEAVQRRLADGRSRGAMCRGLASTEADPRLRELLFKLGPAARDETSCIDMVVGIAEKDDAAFKWLVKEGEPGLLNAASKPTGFMCDKIGALWTGVLEVRSPKEYAAFSVPLSEAIKRCPNFLDTTLSQLLRKRPESHAFVVAAVDPYGGALAMMRFTCAQLGVIAQQHAHPLTRERAGDAYRHGCLSGR